MTSSLAYRDGWLAHMKRRILNPYCELNQYASHCEWQCGHRARAAKLPGAYLEILDQEMMGS